MQHSGVRLPSIFPACDVCASTGMEVTRLRALGVGPDADRENKATEVMCKQNESPSDTRLVMHSPIANKYPR
eukprot:1508536-Amphidinium_carterae.1